MKNVIALAIAATLACVISSTCDAAHGDKVYRINGVDYTTNQDLIESVENIASLGDEYIVSCNSNEVCFIGYNHDEVPWGKLVMFIPVLTGSQVAGQNVRCDLLLCMRDGSVIGLNPARYNRFRIE